MAAAVAFAAASTPASDLRIVDGDTLVLDGVRWRLWGMDAPEVRQHCGAADGESYPCGLRAAAELVRLIDGKSVSCRRGDTDRYGRSVGICKAGGVNLSEAMVRQGWAVDYVRYSGGAYAEAQRDAKAHRRGLWAGWFDLPAEWRLRGGVR